MNKDDLSGYINSNLKRGLKIEEIKQQLLSHGFSDYDINEAIANSNFKDGSPKEEPKQKPKKVESIENWDEEVEEQFQ
ncbi:MAG: hypothetical protein NUV46_04670 [Nanoarchaeota archaeon]|nr:hypothetical protein [Nanoarchaeota archaeon]